MFLTESVTDTVEPAATLNGSAIDASVRSGPTRILIARVLFVSFVSVMVRSSSALTMRYHVPALTAGSVTEVVLRLEAPGPSSGTVRDASRMSPASRRIFVDR